MNLTSIALFLLLSCTLFEAVEAGRGRFKGKRKLKQCVYKRKGEKGICNPNTGNMEIRYTLKASRQRFDCPPQKVKTRKCPGCKYPKRGVPFGSCVNGVKSKEVPLGAGSRPECPPKRIITKPCRQGVRLRKKQQGFIKGCQYVNEDWSVCDEATNTRSRVRKLVAGNPNTCMPKKIVTKRCKKECRYIKGDWSDCDGVTNTKNRTLSPKLGSPATCQSQIQTKSCTGNDDKKGKRTKCRYDYGEWSTCDTRTNTRSREMTLRNGDPNVCKRTVHLVRKCKIACKFRPGKWSACDEMTRLMTREDVLVAGNPKFCEKNRQISKKCRKGKCKYTLGEWGECSPDTNSRTRVKTLIKDNKSDSSCKQEIIITKSCVGKDGEDRCFFGAWGEFGPCKNGAMTKQRKLIQGGVECERKAVVTKACSN